MAEKLELEDRGLAGMWGGREKEACQSTRSRMVAVSRTVLVPESLVLDSGEERRGGEERRREVVEMMADAVRERSGSKTISSVRSRSQRTRLFFRFEVVLPPKEPMVMVISWIHWSLSPASCHSCESTTSASASEMIHASDERFSSAPDESEDEGEGEGETDEGETDVAVDDDDTRLA